MSVICIIPVRGGSKGLLRKNLREIGGHPLMAWPIAAAKACSNIDKIIVSTDDEEMASVARSYGAETPFLRSEAVSGDLATTEETLKYSLLEAEKFYQNKFDIAVFLTATDFFRDYHWVENAISMLKNDNALESVFVANKTHKNYWENNNTTFSRLREWMKVYSSRQIRMPIYREDTGLACASRATLWRDGRRIGDKVKIIEINNTQSGLDIHDEFDLFLAQMAYDWLTLNRPDQIPKVPKKVV